MSWQEFFPYSSRFGQDKIAEFVTKIISGREIGIVEAPYGIGKTITMLASGLSTGKKLVFATCDHAIQETVVKEVFNLNKKLDKKLLVASILGKKHMCPYLEKFDYDICDYERSHNRCPFYNKTYSKKKAKQLSVLASSLLEQIKSLIREASFFENKKFVEFVLEQCKEKGVCPYELMLELASESDVVVLDYFHIFTPIFLLMQKRIFQPSQTILFIDEADRLQPRLLDILTAGISDFGLYKLGRQIKGAMKRQEQRKLKGQEEKMREQIITKEEYDFYLSVYNIFERFLKEKYEKERKNGNELRKDNKREDENKGRKNEQEIYTDVQKQEFIGFLEKALSLRFYEIMFKLDGIIEKLLASGCRKAISRPDKFLSLWFKRENYFGYALFTEINQSLRLSPYELANTPLIEFSEQNVVRRFLLQDILKQFNSVVLFSATIGKPEIFAQCLGIERADFFSSEEFNTENYSVLLKKDISSIYKERENNIKKAIKDITFLEEKLGSLLLAFPSYDCSKDLLLQLQLRHISELEATEEKEGEKENKEEEIKKSLKNTYWVVLGGKGSRGINKAAKLPAVYVFGLQLPKPSDYLFQKRKSYMLRKYEREKALQLLYSNVVNQSCQVAGRIFRHTNKKGIVILADKRYKYDFMLKDFFYNCIPPYFKTKLKEVAQEEFEKEIERFTTEI